MDRDSKTENDIKKEYLSRYIRATRREKRILEEIQRLREDKMFPSMVNDGMPKGNKKSDLSEFAALIDEEIEKLKRERLEKVRAYSDISKKIKAVENDNEREVLELRYIKGMKWEEICLEMSYSWQHIHRIHSKALENFKM
jgi:DNA-directed RNA polymerase specialized sigma subunit